MEKLLAKLRAGEHVTIVALGDSITEITFHTRGHANWVGLLEEAIIATYGHGVLTMINSGKCGAGIEEGVTRLDRDVLRFQPDLVILSYGVNGHTDWRESFLRSMREAITRIQAAGSEVLIRTPNPLVTVHGLPHPPEQPEVGKPWSAPGRGDNSRYAEALVKLAEEMGCAVVDHYAQWCAAKFVVTQPALNPQGLWMRMGDAIHPGYHGHLRFFRELAPLFEVPAYFAWEGLEGITQ